MKVITLDRRAVIDACKKLCEQINDSGFNPDLILGVAKGGIPLADTIHDFLPGKHKIDYCYPLRKSSDRKKKLSVTFLKKMPLFLLNFLRIFEASFLFRLKNRKVIEKFSFPDYINSCRNILIVDDAIDRGWTMVELEKRLRKISPESRYKIAVITVTTDTPQKDADYYLYHDHTLIRFPWSLDAK